MDARSIPPGRWLDPASDYPEYPPGSVVEIRVHGVGGEPPSGMTRDPHPQLVGGDELAGFWRARDPVVGRPRAGSDPRLHVREVLAWGGQTSGTIRHAFWVLLLPFALFNLAGRMHVDGRRGGLHRCVCRALALTMTVTVATMTAATVLDPVALQCAGSAECLSGERAVTWLLNPLRGLADRPTVRIGLVAAVPVLVIAALWWAGRYREPALEGFDDRAPLDAPAPIGLTDPGFWDNKWPASRLRSLHASAAFAAVGAAIGATLAGLDGSGPWIRWVVVPSAVAVVAATVLCLVPRTARPGWSQPLQVCQEVLRLLAVLPLGASIGLTTRERVPELELRVPWLGSVEVVYLVGGLGIVALCWFAYRAIRRITVADARGAVGHALGMIGAAATIAWLWPPLTSLTLIGQDAVSVSQGRYTGGVVVEAHLPILVNAGLQVGLLVVLLTASISPPGDDASAREGAGVLDGHGVWSNLGAGAIALLSLLLITAVGVSLTSFVTGWLGELTVVPSQATTPDTLVLPWWHALTSSTLAVRLPLTLGIAAAVVLLPWRATPKPAEVAGHLGVAEDDPSKDRLRRVGGLWSVHRLVRRGGNVLALGVMAATAWVVFDALRLARHPSGPAAAMTGPMTSISVWVVGGLVLAAVALVRLALTDRGSRRAVGAVWDVATFWPRTTHPFAPPCYGEAVVPTLRRRIERLTKAGYPVMVAGHSQGSVIAMAALATSDARAEQVALVTYGSPIAILYESHYPAAVRPAIRKVDPGDPGSHAPVASWHHLFGLTEPFAAALWRPTDPTVTTDVTDADRRAGWPATLATTPGPFEPCAVCGYLGDEVVAPGTGGAPTRTDHLIADPWPWRWPLDDRRPDPTGHSTYHRHGMVDDHLHQIARSLIV